MAPWGSPEDPDWQWFSRVSSGYTLPRPHPAENLEMEMPGIFIIPDPKPYEGPWKRQPLSHAVISTVKCPYRFLGIKHQAFVEVCEVEESDFRPDF